MTPIETYALFLEGKITLDECIKEIRSKGANIMADAILIVEKDLKINLN